MAKDGVKDGDTVKKEVSEYYGKELKSSSDLRTGACCCSSKPDPAVSAVMKLISDEILDRSYGCGSPIPPLLEGMTVLDLGCGTGRDVYIISKLVGESGHVIGVDMTPEQLEVAERYKDEHMKRFGFREPNVEFRHGYIEDLGSIGIEDDSIDVVVSNCVINLSPEKDKVFSEIFRVLKQGGELYFSDIFADRRVPDEMYNDPVVHGECLGGAMYIGDFRRLMRRIGFMDYRDISVCPVGIDDAEIKEKVGDARFESHTVRAFKVDGMEDECEDYGQSVSYLGNIPGHEDHFDLDDHHRFVKGEWVAICGNTALMCSDTRYGKHLRVRGDRSHHYGKFGCCSDETKRDGGCCC